MTCACPYIRVGMLIRSSPFIFPPSHVSESLVLNIEGEKQKENKIESEK